MGEVRTRSALKGIGSFKPVSEYVLPLELKRGWGFGHKWPLGWGHDKLRLLYLIQENKSIEGYYFLPASDFIPCLDILVVITLVSQSMFQKSDQMLRYQVSGWRRAWPNTKWWREKREAKSADWSGAAIWSPGRFLAPGRSMMRVRRQPLDGDLGRTGFSLGPSRQQSAWGTTFRPGL